MINENPTPTSSGFLDVGQGHSIFYQCYGDENAVPVVYLHGGPGSGFSPSKVAHFIGLNVRFIGFDQRGCGQSTPAGIDEFNTTAHLIEDIETLRKHLGIEKWYVAGASWGSTLALLYAMKHKQSCLGLILASLFLGRRQDQKWSFDGVRLFLPDIFKQIEQGYEEPLEDALYRRLTTGTREEKLEAAYRFNLLGSYLARMYPDIPTREDVDEASIQRAIILLHYAQHGFFVPENTILDNAALLDGLDMWLLQGRFDMDCCVQQAFELKDKCPELVLHIANGGHSTGEPVMAEAFTTIIRDIFSSN